MKQFIFFIILVILILPVFSQKSNVIFFAENGERFNVILNGVQQNASPETNVKITDINGGAAYKVKIIFEDVTLGELDKNIYPNPGTETTLNIKKNKKGKYVLRFQSEVPIAQAPLQTQNQNVITYTVTAPEPTTTANIVVTETTTTTTDNLPDGENISVGIGVSENGVGIDMNVNVNQSESHSSSSTTTTTTTTTIVNENNTAPTTQDHYIMPGYNGPIGCPWPMSQPDFASAKQSIALKDFEDSKLTIAKQIFNTNCLLSSHVKEIMMLFTYEDTKLEFAKYAYGRTFDIGNYYKVNDAFTYETSIDELNNYINSLGR